MRPCVFSLTSPIQRSPAWPQGKAVPKAVDRRYSARYVWAWAPPGGQQCAGDSGSDKGSAQHYYINVIFWQSGNYGRTPCHAQTENRLRVDAKKPGEPGFLDTGFAVTYSAGRMFAACLPFGPVTMSKVTFWFSARVLKPLP